MKTKCIIIIASLIITVLSIKAVLVENQKNKKESIKIPILLYHDFVTTVPKTNPDNFNYINTPQSFEKNIKVLLDNGYTFISTQELNDATNEKIELPDKPILINLDDGYSSNYAISISS